MLSRLIASLQKTITVTAAPERFRFASAGREAVIDTVLRVAPDGRILGFGAGAGTSEGQVIRLLTSGGVAVDERALEALCRRGLALALGPWGIVRPRVVVRGSKQVPVSAEVFARVLRAAGAATVEFAD